MSFLGVYEFKSLGPMQEVRKLWFVKGWSWQRRDFQTFSEGGLSRSSLSRKTHSFLHSTLRTK